MTDLKCVGDGCFGCLYYTPFTFTICIECNVVGDCDDMEGATCEQCKWVPNGEIE